MENGDTGSKIDCKHSLVSSVSKSLNNKWQWTSLQAVVKEGGRAVLPDPEWTQDVLEQTENLLLIG